MILEQDKYTDGDDTIGSYCPSDSSEPEPSVLVATSRLINPLSISSTVGRGQDD